jgi:hypothetical protein
MEATLPSADKDNFKKMKAAYDACVDVEALKQRGSNPLDDVLAQIEKYYPIGGKDSQKNLTDAILYLIQIDVPALTSFSISVGLPGGNGAENSNSLTHSLMTVIRIMWPSSLLLLEKLGFRRVSTTTIQKRWPTTPLWSFMHLGTSSPPGVRWENTSHPQP